MKNSPRIASLVVCVLVFQPSIVTGVRMDEEDSRLNVDACPTSVATKKAFADAESDVNDAKAAVAAADGAVGDARVSKTSADAAVGGAKAAKTSADAAVGDAKADKTSADAAVGNAKADKTSADAAVGDANAAKTSADAAVEDAKAALAAAEATAAKAQSTLETAASAAGTAQSTLATAESAAETAQSALETAESAAGTSQSTLEAAESAAATAQSTLASEESAAGTAESTLASAESAAATAQAAYVAAAKLESECNTCISDRSQYWESNDCKTDDAYRTRFFVRVWTSNEWYAGTNWLPSVQLFEGDDHVSKKVQIGKANDDHDDFETGSVKTYQVDLDHKMKPDKFCISFPGTGDKWLPEKVNLYNNGPYDVYMKGWDWFTKEEAQCKDITDIRMTDPDR